MSSNKDKNVIVVGGGLVGPLFALFMVKRGYNVGLFEKREDPRTADVVKGRSINLALSNRGRKALRQVGLEDEVLACAIPMKGRRIHTLKEDQKSIPYDHISGQCIYSVSRHFLNIKLLNALEKESNVKLFFKHKLIQVNRQQSYVTLLNLETNKTRKEEADLLVGADGAFSRIRACVQDVPAFNFSQTYIDHGYVEMCIPPKAGMLMLSNHLHIWPRGEFMMIALPNLDGSWTVTLFMPFRRFEKLDSPDKLLKMFESVFPDSIALLGEDQLVSAVLKKSPSSLVSIRCSKFHVGEKILLVGDAAHAMVPFYGQGMNSGFEDCTLFDEILDECEDDVPRALERFSARRTEDAHAICDLAMYNYVEMRDLVTRPSYLMRKSFDDFLFWLLPRVWIPLYNSVTFSNMNYRDCIRNRRWQNRVLLLCFSIAFIVVAIMTMNIFF